MEFRCVSEITCRSTMDARGGKRGRGAASAIHDRLSQGNLQLEIDWETHTE